MLYVQATKNLSGLSIWGNTNSLIQLRELMTNLLENNMFFKNQKLVDELYSVPYEIRKAYEGHRHQEKHLDFQNNEYSLYGSECILPFLLIQISMIRECMKLNENTKHDLSIMYAFEFQIEKELHKFFPKDADEIISILPTISSIDQKIIFDKLPSRCNYYLNLKIKDKEKLLLSILKSFLPYYRNTKLDFSINEYPNNIEW